ncbi:MAG: EAL domain-containing protein [Candidatus Thiodiazotropha lotti]|nr:EAL domain-containing protein [Candidatus Thiodiazotropha lotti]
MDDFTTKQIIGALKEGIFITDLRLRIVEVNAVFTEVTGYSLDQVIGKKPKLFSSGRHSADFYQRMWKTLKSTGKWQGTIWNRRKNGEIYPQWQYITTLNDPDGNATHYISVFSDISQQESIENQIHLLAYYDNLTGLPNRTLFTDRLNLSLTQAIRDKGKVALFYLDLDRFKQINDALGHFTGDKLLSAIGYRLRNSLRESDTVARLSGDEFAVIVSCITSIDHAETVAQKIQYCFKSPYTIDHRELQISVSIGICLFPDHARDSEAMVRLADCAMYRAKEIGRNCYSFYSDEIAQQLQQRLLIESDLRHDISKGNLELIYQPQFCMSSGKIVTLETKLRWIHPKYGEISPSVFLPIAEETGLLIQLSYWAIKAACHEISDWRKKYGINVNIAINLFSIQIESGILIKTIEEVISETDLAANSIELEITEKAIMEMTQNDIETFDELNRIGVRIVIDNFGIGYSSLNNIKRIGVKKLKIDSSFTSKIETDSGNNQMIETIINMAHNLTMSITAEGVESESQLKYLSSLKCDYAQGYLTGSPCKVENLISMFPGNINYSSDKPDNFSRCSTITDKQNL